MLEDKRNNLPSSDLNKQYKEISVKDTNTKKEKSHAAAKQAGKALEAGFAEVKTPSQASDVLDRIDNAAGDTKEQDLAHADGSVNPIKQAEALNEAADTAPPKERAAVVLTEAAAQIAASPPKNRETLDEAVSDVSGKAPSKEESPQVERGRDLLRKELISHSFPSGHSAAAFGGATLLQTCYPRGRRLFFAIALLVAFSRVYLGAHYPGDVISGGLAGTALAKLYRSLLTSLK